MNTISFQLVNDADEKAAKNAVEIAAARRLHEKMAAINKLRDRAAGVEYIIHPGIIRYVDGTLVYYSFQDIIKTFKLHPSRCSSIGARDLLPYIPATTKHVYPQAIL